jgi:cell division protein FtsA
MKVTLSIISFAKSGQIQMIVAGQDNSQKEFILSTKRCGSIDMFISKVIRPAIKEVYSRTQEYIQEVIIVLSDIFAEILQNRGYIVRDFETEEISNSDTNRLLNDMYKIHPYGGTKVLNIAPLFYSVDDITNIKDPRGMKGKRLEGKFQIFCGNKKLVDEITSKLKSQGITIKKFIPANMNNADPFLSTEERETLSILDLNN